jgi:hypothetical protein
MGDNNRWGHLLKRFIRLAHTESLTILPANNGTDRWKVVGDVLSPVYIDTDAHLIEYIREYLATK